LSNQLSSLFFVLVSKEELENIREDYNEYF